MSVGIRPYGPGKFDTIIDGYVYELSLDQGHYDLGDVESFNHYSGVLLGREAFDDIVKLAKEQGEPAPTVEEARLIRHNYAAIVEENSQGFVGVTYFRSEDKFEKAWAKLEHEWENWQQETEGGEED